MSGVSLLLKTRGASCLPDTNGKSPSLIHKHLDPTLNKKDEILIKNDQILFQAMVIEFQIVSDILSNSVFHILNCDHIVSR